MIENVSRVEFEDMCRHLTTKADRAQQQAACAMEEAKCLSRALEIASYQIRQLTTWLVPLLSAEQQEVIGVERRAGVTDEPLVTEDVVEANDGDEWRLRLKRRGAELRDRAKSAGFEAGPFPADQVAAMKEVGALFNVLPNDEGPRYNRDGGGVVDGLNDADL